MAGIGSAQGSCCFGLGKGKLSFHSEKPRGGDEIIAEEAFQPRHKVFALLLGFKPRCRACSVPTNPLQTVGLKDSKGVGI